MEQAAKLALINKDAKKFIAKNSHPVLEGIHYAADGSVFVTNKFYGLRIRNAHNFDEEVTISAIDGAKINEPFPNIDRVFPTEFKTSFALNNHLIKDALQKVKWVHGIAKYYDPIHKRIKLILKGIYVFLHLENDSVKFQTIFAPYNGLETVHVNLNAEFLLNGLQVFKDAGTKQLQVKLKGQLDPIVLSDEENEIDVIILPIRTGA